ncbi:unnamed protein product [Calicophoron daubneyi]|uniref:Uncharacterized protein n=1 Tax=Calicophoron daubneyi TaxID=300641 RepID=A0AAV2TRS3_CALDB
MSDEEFKQLMISIRPFYQSLTNVREKEKVGSLIKELVDLSNNEFQKNQRNELAKSLLFKLKSNQLSTISSEEIAAVTEKLSYAKTKRNSCDSGTDNLEHPVQNGRRSRSRKSVKRPLSRKKNSQVNGKMNHAKVLSCKKCAGPKARKVYDLNSRQGRSPAFIGFSVMGSSNSESLTSLTDPEVFNGDDAEYGIEASETDEHLPETDSSGEGNKSFQRTKSKKKASGQNITCSNCKQGKAAHRKEVKGDEDGLKNQQKHKNKADSVPDENLLRTISRLHDKEIQQRAQAAEAHFYERLVELRRENEEEVAKLVSRKNEEIAAVQQAADHKHKELREAVSKLERQLADAVASAEKARNQSAEQSQQLQAAMNSQMETFFQQSAEERQQLVKEHEDTMLTLRTHYEAEIKELEKHKDLVQELQKKLDAEEKRSQELQQSLNQVVQERSDALNSLKEKQEQKLADSQRLTEIQMELNETKTRLNIINSKYQNCLGDHAEELLRLRAENTKQIANMKLEHTDMTDRLNAAMERLKADYENRLKENEMKHSSRMNSELAAAHDRGRQQGLELSEAEILNLRSKLTETMEAKNNYHELLDQAREETLRGKEALKQAEANFAQKENGLLSQIEKLEMRLHLASTNVSTQTTGLKEFESDYVVQRVGQEVIRQMTSWHDKTVEEVVNKARTEERSQLQTLYSAKESQLIRQHQQEMDELKRENLAALNEARKASELLHCQLARLETELGEAKRQIAREVETRRQQLSEISVARETERREWNRSQEEKITELNQKNQELIQRLNQQHSEELQALTTGRLCDIEREYKNRLKELSKRLNESHLRISELDNALQGAAEERQQVVNEMTQNHQNAVERIKQKHHQVIITLKETVASERARARMAEASLRHQEKLWTDVGTRWREGQNNQTEKLLPAEVQTHLEATIESLRLQVTLLQKRIALMEGDKHLCIPSPACIQSSNLIQQKGIGIALEKPNTDDISLGCIGAQWNNETRLITNKNNDSNKYGKQPIEIDQSSTCKASQPAINAINTLTGPITADESKVRSDDEIRNSLLRIASNTFEP